MKKIIHLIFLFVTVINLYSQDQKSLVLRANEMHKHFLEGNYKIAIEEYIYPDAFKFTDKEETIAILENNKEFNNEEASKYGYRDYKVVLVNIPPNFEFSVITKIDDGYYCYLKYDQSSKFVYKDKINENERAELVYGHKKLSGAYEAYFDEKANAVVTKSTIFNVAICNKVSKNKWTFCDISDIDSDIRAKIRTN